ncbi:MAG: tetratricopeptide repeat protein [Gemmatimonadetes bacterium]|nr:tetratricopeptide repeat protein [Gemmatimonadota bacterium]
MRFVHELKRRKVLRVAAVYVSAAFASLEGIDVLVAGFGVSEGVYRVAAALVIAGLPIALGLAWWLDASGGQLRATAPAHTEEGQAELQAAAGMSLLDGRTLLLAGTLVVFGLGLGTGLFLDGGGADSIREGPSIAVLPFENRSSDEDAVFFVDGIHDEVLNRLTTVGAIRVISRSSVMSYRDAPKPIREVGQELGVRTVLEGGVQRAGELVRISVQLVDTRTDEQLWADSYEETLSPENLFAIQRDVSEQIAAALQAELTPSEAHAIAEVPTTNQAAYDAYLRGNAALYRDEILGAADHFSDAVELDPDFALAWARLSLAHSYAYHFLIDRTPSRIVSAKRAVDRALELDPDLPAGLISLGNYHYRSALDYSSALEAFDQAAVYTPNDYDMLLTRAAILYRMGNFEGSRRAFVRAIDVNPLGVNAIWNFGGLLEMARAYDVAAPLFEQVLDFFPRNGSIGVSQALVPLWRDGDVDAFRTELEARADWTDARDMLLLERWRVEYVDSAFAESVRVIDESGVEVIEYQTYYHPATMLMGLARLAAGDTVEARADFEKARALAEAALGAAPDDPRVLAALGQIHAGLGQKDAAVEYARSATAALPVERDAVAGPDFVLDLARTHAMVGDLDAAVDALDVYLSHFGQWSLEGLLALPVFAGLDRHPRFPELEATAAAWRARIDAALAGR